MARRPRVFAPGLLYHVIARGNRRQPTFLTDGDYESYLIRLARYRKRYDVRLYAYCLMPNHVHLLVQPSECPLAKFMQVVQQSYTQRFNTVHGLIGHLFHGRYKAIVCETDAYLTALVRYIHLNPVRAGLVDDPAAYPYSGHRAYLRGDRRGLIDPRPVLNMLGGCAAYRRFVRAAIATGHDDRYYATQDQQFLGAPGFAQRLGLDSAQPAGRVPRKSLRPVVDELADRLGLDAATLRSPDRSGRVNRARAALSFVLVRRLGYPVVDVAAELDRSAGTVSGIVSRLGDRLESSTRAVADVARLEGNR